MCIRVGPGVIIGVCIIVVVVVVMVVVVGWRGAGWGEEELL